jgi:predicted nuclease of predicted toxin-antitoxin system
MAGRRTGSAFGLDVKILIDMNLPPRWVQLFANAGWEALHWSQVGSPTASDREIMAWARENGYIVFTHDLDFSALPGGHQKRWTQRHPDSYAKYPI